MTQLSICIPSNRKLIDSQRSLDSSIAFSAQRENCEISISDNSNDPDKFSKYSKLNRDNLIYSTCNFDESNNGKNAFEKTSGKFIGFMADDDFILALGPNQILNENKNVSGYRPNFATWEKDKGITRVTNFSITGKTARERIQCYVKNAKGNNNTLYSFFKRELVTDISNLCMLHPIKAGYYDWAMVLAYASNGEILADNSTLYVYDNHNWSGTNDDIASSIKRLLNKGGLDDRAPLFLNLLLAIDSFILITRKSSPLDNLEKLDAGMTAFVGYLNAFLRTFHSNKIQFTQSEINIITELSNTKDLSKLLTSALNVIEAYNPELITQYMDFYFISIGHKWGKF